jgi:tetratricopeptide (TPR) repeat protein
VKDRALKHFDKGADCARQGEPEKAIALLDKALTLEPANDMLWVLRGSLLYDLRRYDEAVDSHDRAIAIKPDYAVAWYNRGIALFRLARYPDALASFDRALELNPEYADAKKRRETVLREQENSRTV